MLAGLSGDGQESATCPRHSADPGPPSLNETHKLTCCLKVPLSGDTQPPWSAPTPGCPAGRPGLGPLPDQLLPCLASRPPLHSEIFQKKEWLLLF